MGFGLEDLPPARVHNSAIAVLVSSLRNPLCTPLLKTCSSAFPNLQAVTANAQKGSLDERQSNDVFSIIRFLEHDDD